ncbi:MAG: beta-lactamase family protein, partial [Candidatus Eremiobacteraeota bacterium]|nr:beta-lactamase family protein [Candidatus Eremiobacteraeota bacterium]
YTATDIGMVALPQFDPQLSFAAGGIRSSAHDLALWASALMHDQRFQPYFAQMTSRIRLGSYDSPYAEGFFVDTDGTQTIAWHDGTVAGFKSMEILAQPGSGAVIVLANADTAPAPELARQIRDLIAHRTGRLPLAQLNAEPSWWSRALLAAIAALLLAVAVVLIVRRPRVSRQ